MLTPADFVSEAAFAREAASLFASAWIPVCRAEEVANAGDQKASRAGTTPVLLTRDSDGRLSALSNVCRHRGSTLVDERAQASVIRCPYHLWTYGLDGRLASAPFMEGADLSACDLPRYRAEEWGGFVFVNLDGRAAPLEEALDGFPCAIPAERLAGLREGFRMDFDHPWNWKVMVENFGESYHHVGPHAETLQPLWAGGKTDSSPSTDRWIEIRHPTSPEAGTLQVLVGFPLFLVAVVPEADAGFWYRMSPLGPERIRLSIVGLYAPERAADPAAMEEAKAQTLAIHLEDIAICERVQAGLHSPDAVLGPLSPLEAGLARFRDYVDGQPTSTV